MVATPVKQTNKHMFQQTPRKPVLSSFAFRPYRALKGIAVGIFALFVATFALTAWYIPQTSATTSNTINFQARLQSSNGSIAPDGDYNVEFKLYDALSGGTLLWTEDHLNNTSTQVHVVNGYLTVNLGSITSFGSLNWNQQMWLTMNVGDTTNCTPFLTNCSPDGEMSPRIQLTAVPYALQAGALGATNGANVATLDFTTPTGTRAIHLPDEGGTLCIQGSTNCSFAPASGSTNYVQLQGSSPGAQQTSGNFNISGTGLLSAVDATTSNGTLNLGASRANTIQLGNITAATTLSLQGGTGASAVGIQAGASGTISIATTAQAQTIQIGTTAVNSGNTQTIGIGNLNAAGTTNVTIGTGTSATGGATTLQAHDVLTLTGTGGITASGAAASSLTTSSGALTITSNAAATWSTSGTNQNLTLQASGTATLALQTAGAGTVSVANNSQNVIVNIGNTVAAANTTTVNEATSTGAAQTVNIGGTNTSSATSHASTVVNIQGGATGFKVANAGTTLQTWANSTTALKILNSSSSTLFNADTTNMRLGVDVTYALLGTPTISTVTASAGAGLANGTYRYEVTAIDSAGGESALSNEVAGTSSGSNHILTVSWGAVSGATAYRIYRTTGTTGTSGTEKYLTSVVATSFADSDGIALTSTSPPVSSTLAYTSTNVTNNKLQLAVGGYGTPTGQLYVSGNFPATPISTYFHTNPGNGWPGTTYIQGHYAYVGNGLAASVMIDDIGNPYAPVQMSTAATTIGNINDLVVQGDYMYAIGASNLMAIVNIANAASPTTISTIATGSAPSRVVVAGKYAYVTSSTAHTFVIYDISNPSNPIQISSTDQGAATTPSAIALAGHYAYVSRAGSNSVAVYDISNPASLPAPTTFTVTGGAAWMYISGRYLYEVDGGSNMRIYDLSSPTAPTLVSTTGVDNFPHKIIVQGRYAYVTADQANPGTLSMYDVSNPTAPFQVGNMSLVDNNPYSFDIQGRYLYVVTEPVSRMDVFDIGGAYSQNLEAGNTVTGALQVTANSNISGSENIQGGLYIGQDAQVTGDLGVNGSASFATATNSATGFQVQNAAGDSMLMIDTTNANLISNSTFEANSTGWAATGTGASITRNTTQSNSYNGLASLQVTTGTTANSGARVSTFSATLTPTTYTLSFYAKASTGFSDLGVVATGGSVTCTLNSATVSTSGFQRYFCTFTSSGSNITNITIGETGTTSHVFYLDGVQLIATATLTPYKNGTLQFNGLVNNALTIQPAAASNAAFQVLDGSSINLLNVDTISDKVDIGIATTAAQTVDLGGVNTSSATSHASTVVNIQGGAVGVSVANTGVLLKTWTNAAAAFQVQNSSSNPLLTVDTSNSQVSIPMTVTATASRATFNIGSGGFAGGGGNFAGSSSGTLLGLNAASSYGGNLIDLQTNGVSELSVDAVGRAIINSKVTINSSAGDQFGIQVNGADIRISEIANPTTAPTLGSNASGALGATTYYVEYTWNSGAGQSQVSSEANIVVAANRVLTVTVPAFPVGITSANVYVSNTAGGGSGAETAQATIATSGGTWTEPTSGLVVGSGQPCANTTGGQIYFRGGALRNDCGYTYLDIGTQTGVLQTTSTSGFLFYNPTSGANGGRVYIQPGQTSNLNIIDSFNQSQSASQDLKITGSGQISTVTIDAATTAFTGNGTFNSQVTLGTASSTTGSALFKTSTSANTVTLSVGSTSTNYSILLPTAGGSANQCLQLGGGGGSQLQWGACGGGATGLAKNAADSSSASISASSFLYNFTNSNTSTSGGVLKLDNGNNTGDALQVLGNLMVKAQNDQRTIGSELYSGDFSGGSWTTTNWTLSGGNTVATHTTGNTSALTDQTHVTITAGTYYQVSFAIGTPCSTSSDTLVAAIGGTTFATINGSNCDGITTTYLVQATNTNKLTFTPSTNWSGSVTIVSVKALSGSISNSFVLQNASGSASLEIHASADTTNMFIGRTTGSNVVSGGCNNVGVGNLAFQNLTSGCSSVAVGYQALQNLTTSGSNVAVGIAALQNDTTAGNNTGLGAFALQSATTGGQNSAVGSQALQFNTTGFGNNALGVQALYTNTNGNGNTAIGNAAMYSNTSSSDSTALGYSALYNSTGQHNVGLGSHAGESVTSGQGDTFLGFNSGKQDVNGNFATVATVQNSAAIGQFAQVQSDNTIALGSVDTTTKVVIGSTIADNLLSVSPLFYGSSTNGSQSTNTLTDASVNFTTLNVKIGMRVIYANGTDGGTVTAVGTTTLTLSTSQTVSAQRYRIHIVGFQVTTGGAALVQTTSTTAFQVQNSAAASYLTVDTSSTVGKLQVGSSTTDGTAILLVLDSYNTTDPTGTNGGMYYSTNTNTFRCYENGAWADCLSRHEIVLGSDVADSSGNCTFTNVTGLSFSVASGVNYRFTANIIYTSAATTTGVGFGATGPAHNQLAVASFNGGNAVTAGAGTTANGTFTCSANTGSTGTDGEAAFVTGFISPTASGTLQLQFASEINTSAITIKAGSTLEWW